MHIQTASAATPVQRLARGASPEQPAQVALQQALSALAMAERSLRPFAMSHALAQVGRCWHGLQALPAAESHYEQALRWARLTGSTDQVVDVLCALGEVAVLAAEQVEMQAVRAARLQDRPTDHFDGADRQTPGQDVQTAQAARERARDHAFEAAGLASHVADPLWEVRVLLRLSDVLDRCGEHHDAAALQSRALLLMGEGWGDVVEGVDAADQQTTVAASL